MCLCYVDEVGIKSDKGSRVYRGARYLASAVGLNVPLLLVLRLLLVV